MSRKGQSFYIDSHGPDEESLIAGTKCLMSAASKCNNVGVIAVHSKQNLNNLHGSKFGTLFADLAKHNTLDISGITLRLFTMRMSGISSCNDPILALYGYQKLLDAIDALDGQADVLFVPWNREEAQDWIDTWDAKELSGTGEIVISPDKTIEPPKLWHIALDRLTALLNLSTGIIHSSDKLHAITTLETLYHKNEMPVVR